MAKWVHESGDDSLPDASEEELVDLTERGSAAGASNSPGLDVECQDDVGCDSDSHSLSDASFEDEDEGDGFGDQGTQGPASRSAAQQLARLTKAESRGGRAVVSTSLKNLKRRVMRKDGTRDKVAKLFAKKLEEINDVHNLAAVPLKLKDVMEKMDEGRDLLARIESAKRDRVLAEGARLLVEEAGRANRGPMLGILASPNAQGQVSIGDLSSIMNVSKSRVASCRRTEVTYGPKPASTFRDQQMPLGVTRKKVPDAEEV